MAMTMLPLLLLLLPPSDRGSRAVGRRGRQGESIDRDERIREDYNDEEEGVRESVNNSSSRKDLARLPGMTQRESVRNDHKKIVSVQRYGLLENADNHVVLGSVSLLQAGT
jgi:hypothetical protein